MKTLLAFFSRADENYFGGQYRYIEIGNTEVIANQIKELCNTDVYKIEMKKPYSKVYNTCIDEAKKDLQANARPEILNMPANIDDYDNIILAYPNYWGTAPVAVFTFLESFDFSKKTVYPLCTNEGSGMGRSEADIKKIAKCEVKKGLSIIGSNVNSAKPQVEKWLKANNLI